MNDLVPRRKATNISLNVKLVEEARELGVNLSRACEAGLEAETKAAREAAFLKENAESFAAWRRYHEEHGLPLGKYRMF